MMALQHFMKTFHLPPLDSCYRGASVATVETELVARAPSQLWRPRGSPFCTCSGSERASAHKCIAIFRTAPPAARRLGARSGALKRRDPYCRFSDWASIMVQKKCRVYTIIQ